MENAKDVDSFIASAPKDAQPKLREVRAAIRDAAPAAKESISYRIPFYYYKGRLAWFGLSKAHIGLYLRPPMIADHRAELKGYTTTKSAIHLPLDRKIPAALIKKLVKEQVKRNDAGLGS
ncbi:MAG: DUF1801 domain-containing protein [Thaumarchaeota archaeon]|nr:DUF1801 domain-containing protein [Nitrososphaerota archaeon]